MSRKSKNRPPAIAVSPPGSRQPSHPWSRTDWILALLLVAGIFIIYQPVWQAGFIWDDESHLTANPCIVGPLGFSAIWSSPNAEYYPLVLTSFWLQHALWGLNPIPYHLVNIAMHAGCAILLFIVLRALNVRGAWLGAALWAFHPVMVESVAWVTELKNTQSCFFYLLAILCFLRSRQNARPPAGTRKAVYYALALAFGTLAILSKSSTVMLPVVLALCAWWMDGRWSWRTAGSLLPFLAVSLIASSWTVWEQKFHSGALGHDWDQTWPERIVIAGKAIWFYLGKLAWPHPLVFIYPRWKIDASQPLAWLPALAVAAGLVILWRGRNDRMRPLFFAASYFVVSLFPVLAFFSIYFFRYSFVADHFQYLASISPLALVAAGMAGIRQPLMKWNRLAPAAICLVLLGLLGSITWLQSATYRDIETLWRTTFDRNPNCFLAENDLGMIRLNQGRLAQAAAMFADALRINPAFADAHYNLGLALQQESSWPEAIAQYQNALEDDPRMVVAYDNLGGLLEQSGNVEAAVADYQKALAIDGRDAEAWNNLGGALVRKGELDQAVADLQKAIEIKPGYAEPHYNLGVAYRQKGDPGDSIAQYEAALQIKPDFAGAQGDLAYMLAVCRDGRLRDGAKAEALAGRVNQLSGGTSPVVLATLAAAYAEQGRFDEAKQTVQRAIQLAQAQGNTSLSNLLQGHLKLYQAGHPLRDF